MDLPQDFHFRIADWIHEAHRSIDHGMRAVPTRAFRLYLNYANACADIFYLLDKGNFDRVEQAMEQSRLAFDPYRDLPISHNGKSFVRALIF